MRRSIVAIVVFGTLLVAAPASAQSFGGGWLPRAVGPTGSFTPTVGIVLQPRGGQIAIRFDTVLRCARDTYTPVGRAVVGFDGHSFSARKLHWQFPIGRGHGNRVSYSWRLHGTVEGSLASGTLRFTATRHSGGRSARCRKPMRRWVARLEGPAPTGAPMPPAGAGFAGLDDIDMGDGLRGPVLLRVSRTGKKIGARWTARAACRGQRPHVFVNYTPPMRFRPDGSFSRAERFSFGYADALIRYRVRFAGRISGEMANGTLRLRARIYSPDGKRLQSRCDSGVRNWSAARVP